MTATQKAEFVKLQASVKALEAEAQAGREAKLELERTQLKASVQSHADRGAIKSDQVDNGVELLLASSTADRAKLSAFLDALPTNELLKAEAGHGGEGGDKVEITKEEAEAAEAFGNTPEEIAAYKAKQEKENK
jgi:hypothetical protein